MNRQSDVPCLTCGKEPRVFNRSYCRGCYLLRQKTYPSHQPNGRGKGYHGNGKGDLCNCGNPACTGVRCNYLRPVSPA